MLGREGICSPGRLSPEESQGRSPAGLLPVSGMHQVHDQIRRAERLNGKGSGLGGGKPAIAFIGSRKAWATTSWGRRPSANEARGGCVPRAGQMSSSSTSCLDGRTTHYVPGLVSSSRHYTCIIIWSPHKSWGGWGHHSPLIKKKIQAQRMKLLSLVGICSGLKPGSA